MKRMGRYGQIQFFRSGLSILGQALRVLSATFQGEVYYVERDTLRYVLILGTMSTFHFAQT